MPDGKHSSKPPEPKSPAALGKASNDFDDINRRSFFLAIIWLGWICCCYRWFYNVVKVFIP